MFTDHSTYIIKAKHYDKVINYFLSNNNNTESVIAKKLNLKLGYVKYVINFHLSLKNNYMGAEIVVNQEAQLIESKL